MRNTLKFLLCAICCTVVLNNCVYSQNNVAQTLHQSQYYWLSAEDEQLLVQELFYQLRSRFMLHDDVGEINNISQNQHRNILKSLWRLGYGEVEDLAHRMLEVYDNELSDVLQEPYSQSTNAAKQRVLQMAQKVMLGNVQNLERLNAGH